MIVSICDRCCHIENNKCLADQFYISTPKNNLAPGFCRIYRSIPWAKNQKSSQDISLIQLAKKESELSYDLVIIHSSDDHLETLKNNLSYNSCPALSSTNRFYNPLKHIIVADTTNKKDRSQVIELFQQHKDVVKLDVLVNGEEEKPTNTINRIVKLVKEKYFVIIPSSKILCGRDNEIMINEINNRDSRFIYWPFKTKLAQTEILPLQPIWGLYIKNSYDKLLEPRETPKTFYEILKEEELSTGISLCCPLDIII